MSKSRASVGNAKILTKKQITGLKTRKSYEVHGNFTFKNDNTSKLVGFDYQKLIAIEVCLNANKNETIWIECLGDVADTDSSIEVKHHQAGGVITDNSVDVWKTLKNYVIELKAIESFQHLILHTTAIVEKDSIFYDWDNVSPVDRVDRILKYSPVKTTKPFFEQVKKVDQTELNGILQKFKILQGQSTVKEKWDQLRDHSTFKMIQEQYKDDALKLIYGHITKMAIDNSKQWKIDINDFNRDLKNLLAKYVHGETPFPIIEKKDLDLPDVQNFKFLQKMKVVGLKEREQNNAVLDYLRANLSQIKLIEVAPTIYTNLDNYDSDVDRMVNDHKNARAQDVKEEDIDTDSAHKDSRKVFFDCINTSHSGIVGVRNTEKYYRDGRIHHVLEETGFQWMFTKDEI